MSNNITGFHDIYLIPTHVDTSKHGIFELNVECSFEWCVMIWYLPIGDSPLLTFHVDERADLCTFRDQYITNLRRKKLKEST